MRLSVRFPVTSMANLDRQPNWILLFICLISTRSIPSLASKAMNVLASRSTLSVGNRRPFGGCRNLKSSSLGNVQKYNESTRVFREQYERLPEHALTRAACELFDKAPSHAVPSNVLVPNSMSKRPLPWMKHSALI